MAVTLKRDGDFAVLTLDRPEALNALSFAIIRQIGEALDALAARRSAPAPTSRNCATAR
jgi:enoyl-CoA hydratase